jgi:site-specific recombinase XerD
MAAAGHRHVHQCAGGVLTNKGVTGVSGDTLGDCAAAGLPMIRLHDTRHTAATRMLDSGTSVSPAAKWLGHDPAMTLRVYGHVYDAALASAGDVLLGGMPRAQEG